MNHSNYQALTVLVNSCDAYEDVWGLFFSAYHEFASGLPANIALNTESKQYEDKCVNVETINFLNVKGDLWGKRLLHALKAIKTEYILMVCEDFVLESSLDKKRILDCLHFMKTHDETAAIYLVKVAEKIIKNSDIEFEELTRFMDYKVNSAPAIWRKNDLIRYVGEIDSPWAWEYFGSYRSYFDGRKFYQVPTKTGDLYIYNSKLGGAIYRGKWVRDVVENKIKKYNLPIDLENRGIANLSELPKRSLKWKVSFFYLGYRMIGLPVLLFFFRALCTKILRRNGLA
ncbi:hypothetical protein [Endozoicomonas sp. SESOKO1]|uniref:hypothetical protein n=1 Tax=Endozoicomonas sp. SESOKO1 TaxID=2828742 RepID=UPI0021484F3E|nr:hypothetical protein [Endozoicomonas sp. SESOKO1]